MRRTQSCFLLLFALLVSPVSDRAAIGIEQGEAFTTFLAETINGDLLELAAVRGERAIIVDFWATWCPPSLKQRKQLAASLDQGHEDYLWISVSLDRDLEAARNYIAANPTSAINVCDGESFDGAWSQRFGVVFAPTIYLIGKEGYVRVVSNEVHSSKGDVESLLASGVGPYTIRKGDETIVVTDSAFSNVVRPQTATIGEPAPAFRLKPINGVRVNLDQYQGNVLLVVVFAHWDGASEKFLLEVTNELYARYRPYGFELLGLSISDETEKLKKWLRDVEFKEEFPVAIQRQDDATSVTFPGNQFPMPTSGKALPRSFLIGKNSVVRDMGELSIDRIKQVLVEELNVPF